MVLLVMILSDKVYLELPSFSLFPSFYAFKQYRIFYGYVPEEERGMFVNLCLPKICKNSLTSEYDVFCLLTGFHRFKQGLGSNQF